MARGRQKAPEGAPRASARRGVRTVTASLAARRFGALLDEVRRTGESVIVTQHGRPACRIAPPPAPESTVETLLEVLERAPRVDADFLDTVERIARDQPLAPPTPWDE
jgi:prevent-host-death family protein